jgi:hypothetical protein
VDDTIVRLATFNVGAFAEALAAEGVELGSLLECALLSSEPVICT